VDKEIRPGSITGSSVWHGGLGGGSAKLSYPERVLNFCEGVD
jgi:hypothetical protein